MPWRVVGVEHIVPREEGEGKAHVQYDTRKRSGMGCVVCSFTPQEKSPFPRALQARYRDAPSPAATTMVRARIP